MLKWVDKPDWISVESPDNSVEVKSIDYVNELIVLATPITWKDKDRVWL